MDNIKYEEGHWEKLPSWAGNGLVWKPKEKKEVIKCWHCGQVIHNDAYRHRWCYK